MSAYSPQQFYSELVRHRLIVPSGVPGVFARGAGFEEVVERFEALVSRFSSADGATRLRCPPVLSRKVFEKSGYLDSFPHLAGSVFSFEGTEAQHKELSARVKAGAPWADLQTMTDVVLAPAVCYNAYPNFSGTLPKEGGLVDVSSWVFRHEPSPDPTRLQSFRIREIVRAGEPELVVNWRDTWLKRGVDILQSLGLPVRTAIASDPFFGRGGRMLKANQQQQELKFEVLVSIVSEDSPTAVCSFNYHQEHFGEAFDIRTAEGKVAHSACLGFGLERIVMALFKVHGFVSSEWPTVVRERLWS